MLLQTAAGHHNASGAPKGRISALLRWKPEAERVSKTVQSHIRWEKASRSLGAGVSTRIWVFTTFRSFRRSAVSHATSTSKFKLRIMMAILSSRSCWFCGSYVSSGSSNTRSENFCPLVVCIATWNRRDFSAPACLAEVTARQRSVT